MEFVAAQRRLTVHQSNGNAKPTPPPQPQKMRAEMSADNVLETKQWQTPATIDSTGPKITAGEISPLTSKNIDGIPPGTTRGDEAQKANNSVLTDKARVSSRQDFISYVFNAVDEQIAVCREVQGIVQGYIPETTEMLNLAYKVIDLDLMAQEAELREIRRQRRKGSELTNQPGDSVHATASEPLPAEQTEGGSVAAPRSTAADSNTDKTIKKMGEQILARVDRCRVKLMARVKQLQSRPPVAIDKKANGHSV